MIINLLYVFLGLISASSDSRASKGNIISLAFTDGAGNVDIVFNPTENGDCQFAAIAHLLQLHGVKETISASDVRHEIVMYMTQNPFCSESFSGASDRPTEPVPLSAFLQKEVDGSDWVIYLKRMSLLGTYGDHLTLRSAAKMYNIQFVLFSTHPNIGVTVISPKESGVLELGIPMVCLGHVAESMGKHYMSLAPKHGNALIDLLHTRNLMLDEHADILKRINLSSDQFTSSNHNEISADSPDLISVSSQSALFDQSASALPHYDLSDSVLSAAYTTASADSFSGPSGKGLFGK